MVNPSRHLNILLLSIAEMLLWRYYRRCWANAIKHPHDAAALAEYKKALEMHDAVLFKLSEVRHG